MTSYPEMLFERFRAKGALVDTNLLLLLLIGRYDTALIGAPGFKRVAQFNLQDYAILVAMLQEFRVTVTTPHILAEISNLASQLPAGHKERCLHGFADTFRPFAELEMNSVASAERSDFPRIGLTDAVITELASEYLVITDDLRLCNSMNGRGLDALNFNHIRSMAWGIV